MHGSQAIPLPGLFEIRRSEKRGAASKQQSIDRWLIGLEDRAFCSGGEVGGQWHGVPCCWLSSTWRPAAVGNVVSNGNFSGVLEAGPSTSSGVWCSFLGPGMGLWRLQWDSHLTEHQQGAMMQLRYSERTPRY